jgi:lysylphosphatidylglycerol synthetase-like protein (DUF2156 family)
MGERYSEALNICLVTFLIFCFLSLLSVLFTMTLSGMIIGYYFPVCTEGVRNSRMVSSMSSYTLPPSAHHHFSLLKDADKLQPNQFCKGVKVGMALSLTSATLVLMASVTGVMAGLLRHQLLTVAFLCLHVLSLFLCALAVLFYADKLCSASPFTRPINIFSAMNLLWSIIGLLIGGLLLVFLETSQATSKEAAQERFIWD